MNTNAGTPQGNFTNSSLNGAYAFAFSGTNLATGVFFTMAGSLQANGSGTITGGTIDINSPGSAVPLLTNASLTGTYIVHADGRGAATLVVAGASNNVSIDFVLFSNQHGAVIRFDNFATASGGLDMQNSSAFNLASLTGSFAFNVAGINNAGAPEASAGVFTNSAGTVTAGIQDTSDNGTLFNGGGAGDTLTAGTLNPPSGASGRGTMSLTSTALGTRNFAFYIVNANQIRLIQIDSTPVLAGDAFRQSSTAISGSFAFTNSGANGGVPFAEGGILVTDGGGHVQPGSVEDVNNAGTISTNVALSGTYAVAGNGRGTLNLGTINFAIYPSTVGIQLLEIDNNTVISGTAFQQSGSFSNSTISGRYGANVTGVVSNGITTAEFDAVYQFTANGNGALTGAQDVNVGGTLSANLAFNGTATLDPNGRSSATGRLNTAAGNLTVIYYAVNSSRILFIEVDTGAVAVGTFSQQQ